MNKPKRVRERVPETQDVAEWFDGWADIRHRMECVARTVREMAEEAVAESYTGTIGIEIPVRQGKLGEVRRQLRDAPHG